MSLNTMTREEYFRRWSQLHGGVDPTGSWLIRGWLTMTYALARPLARVGISPNLMTLLAVLIALAAPVVALIGRDQSESGWLWLSVVAVVLCGLADGLDGAIAVLTSRTTAWGYVIDSLGDRVSEWALLLALWLAGAPAWACVSAAAVTVLQEYARARASGVGMTEVGVITISERPTRLSIVGVFLGLAAWAPDGVATRTWAGVGAYAAATVALIGLGQVLIAIHSGLRQINS